MSEADLKRGLGLDDSVADWMALAKAAVQEPKLRERFFERIRIAVRKLDASVRPEMWAFLSSVAPGASKPTRAVFEDQYREAILSITKVPACRVPVSNGRNAALGAAGGFAMKVRRHEHNRVMAAAVPTEWTSTSEIAKSWGLLPDTTYSKLCSMRLDHLVEKRREPGAAATAPCQWRRLPEK